jgi:hypothetical protein
MGEEPAPDQPDDPDVNTASHNQFSIADAASILADLFSPRNNYQPVQPSSAHEHPTRRNTRRDVCYFLNTGYH